MPQHDSSGRRKNIPLRGNAVMRRRLTARRYSWLPRGVGVIKWTIFAGVYLTVVFSMALLGATMRPYTLPPQRLVPAAIYASDGALLGRLESEPRRPVNLGELPPHVIHTILAAEDVRFFQHHGLDWHGIARAAWVNLRARRIVQGGSTITQQLVRMELLNDRRTLHRKLREVVLALRLERAYPKQTILERYLNIAYFGEGAYGIGAAAHVYFHKPAGKLTLAESALLAGLIRAPSAGNPHHNYPIARYRQRAILSTMQKYGWISPAQDRAARAAHLTLYRSQGVPWRAPYAVAGVRQELLRRYDPDFVYRGGLRVYTTINSDLQRAAERALAASVRAGRSRGVGNGALIAIEPDTGAIRAMVGGTDYHRSQFNRATQAHRQPGSAFKAFVYQAAYDIGLSPFDTAQDAPITIGRWSPHNYGNRYRGTVTLADALAYSLNSVSVRLVAEMSPYAVMAAAMHAGITSRLQPNLTIALGASEVTPLEMARAFATYANGGVSVDPYVITQINYGDSVLYRVKPIGRQTVKPTTAYILTKSLQGVITRGTGRRANIGRPAAGKTGTSNEYRDAWFIGYTPYLSAAVWMGNDDRRPMRGVAGGSFPAQAWANFMRAAHRRLPPTDFPPPGGVMQVTLCRDSTLLAVPACPRTMTAYLSLTNVPSGYCDLHSWVTRTVCADSGLLAKPTCPRTTETRFPYDGTPVEYCPLDHRPAPPVGPPALPPVLGAPSPPPAPEEASDQPAPPSLNEPAPQSTPPEEIPPPPAGPAEMRAASRAPALQQLLDTLFLRLFKQVRL
ncbi:MAG: transglycosylase domain-containing protein [Armatimonadota bacterium]